MALRVNAKVYVPHLDKWGCISACYETRCQVKFTEITDTSLYDLMYNEVNTYETFHNSRIVAYYPTNSWVKYGEYSARVLSATYDTDERQFRYKIHVSADEFPCHPMDYLPSDQEYTVMGYDLN